MGKVNIALAVGGQGAGLAEGGFESGQAVTKQHARPGMDDAAGVHATDDPGAMCDQQVAGSSEGQRADGRKHRIDGRPTVTTVAAGVFAIAGDHGDDARRRDAADTEVTTRDVQVAVRRQQQLLRPRHLGQGRDFTGRRDAPDAVIATISNVQRAVGGTGQGAGAGHHGGSGGTPVA